MAKKVTNEQGLEIVASSYPVQVNPKSAKRRADVPKGSKALPAPGDIDLGNRLENIGKEGYQTHNKVQGKDSVPAKGGSVVRINDIAESIADAVVATSKVVTAKTLEFIAAFYDKDVEQYKHNIWLFQKALRVALYKRYGVPDKVIETAAKLREPAWNKALAKINVSLWQVTQLLNASLVNHTETIKMLKADGALADKVKKARALGTKQRAEKAPKARDWHSEIEAVRNLFLKELPAEWLASAVAKVAASLKERQGWEELAAYNLDYVGNFVAAEQTKPGTLAAAIQQAAEQVKAA